jgi:hypothetical protein
MSVLGGGVRLTGSLLVVVAMGALAAPAWANEDLTPTATVALWHMNETSGSIMRDAAGTNDGTITNVALGQPGFKKRAYGFNGSSSHVNVPSAASLNPESMDFMVTVRVRFSVTPPPDIGDYDLVRKGLCCGTHWKVEILPDGNAGRAFCYFRGSSGTGSLTAGPDLSDDQWHTIICKKTATSMILTVDGQNFTQNVTIGSISNGSQLTLGYKTSLGDWYNGLMDEVKIVKG